MAMANSARKRRATGSQANGDAAEQLPEALSASILSAATPDEKRAWQGFCEIESEPAFFNVMLKDFGVRGVKVQEVFGLDEDLLAMLPKPVYGLIFLFRYKTDDLNNQEATCPDNVWFANQTADFACATVAMLNIVNNVPGLELGPNLEAFKQYTSDFTPALRGDAIENFAFVKEIHNSFARKMDMLNIDLSLQNAYDDRRKRKSTAQPKETPKKKSKKKSKNSVVTSDDFSLADDDAAFHFSAYVPIDGEIWKLDGLDRQPQRLGEFGDVDWLSVISPVIQNQMMAYAQGQIEFGLLSLVKDPIVALRADLAQNMKSIDAIEKHLAQTPAATYIASQSEPSDGPFGTYASDQVLEISCATVDEAAVLPEIARALADPATGTAAFLRAARQSLISDHAQLRREVLDEMYAARNDEQKAWDRRQDYSPAIHAWLRMLAHKEDVLKELIEDTLVRENGGVLD